MSGKALDDVFRSKRGVAVLAACIVQTLGESDETFQKRFLERLERAYHEIRDGHAWPGEVSQELELLSWTRELLTGFSPSQGPGTPFLGDR